MQNLIGHPSRVHVPGQQLRVFAGNPLDGAVCINYFKKCTYCFGNVKDNLINEK